MTVQGDKLSHRHAWRKCTLLFASVIFTLLWSEHQTKAQPANTGFDQIIRLIVEIPKLRGQDITDKTNELIRKASAIRVNADQEQDRIFIKKIENLLVFGSDMEQSQAAEAVFYIDFNSADLVKALDIALLKANNKVCTKDGVCMLASSSAVDTICRALSRKDPGHARPRCKYTFF